MNREAYLVKGEAWPERGRFFSGSRIRGELMGPEKKSVRAEECKSVRDVAKGRPHRVARTFNGVRYSTLNRWLGFLGGTGWVLGWVFCCDLGCERVFWGLIGVKNCRNGAKKLLRVVRLTIMIESLVVRILVKGYQS